MMIEIEKNKFINSKFILKLRIRRLAKQTKFSIEFTLCKQDRVKSIEEVHFNTFQDAENYLRELVDTVNSLERDDR